MTSQDLRIVSLLPSATEILAVLGLLDVTVGRSHECDYPPEIQNRPVCTEARLSSERPSAQIDQDVQQLLRSALSIYNIRLDVLEQLQPTHIVTQDQCDVCAVSFAEVERAIAQLTSSKPKLISLQPNTLNEVWMDIERVATQLGVDPEPVLDRLKARVDACVQTVQGLPQPTVAAIEWTDPLMGSGNWIPELVQLAGGHNLFGTVGQHAQYLAWDGFLAADPDVIVMMPCGFDLERTRRETDALAKNPNWPELRAVREGKVYITDGNSYFNRPGPRLVDSLEILAEIFHPDRGEATYQGLGWERFTEAI